jgi:hypothetical protein
LWTPPNSMSKTPRFTPLCPKVVGAMDSTI